MKKRIKLLIVMLAAVIGIASLMGIVAYAEGVDQVNLTIDGGEGNTVKSSTVDKDTTYTLPTYTELGFTAPDGKQFKAWQVGEDEFDPGDVISITEDTIVKAIWENISYTVCFSGGVGTGQKDSVTWGPSVYGVPDHSGFDAPEGYEFAGWSIGEDTSTLYNEGDQITLTSDVTLVANWKLKTYTVTFNAGDGSGVIDPVDKKYGDEYELPDECKFTAPTGMEFAGWEINGLPATGTINIIGDVTVKATWKLITYTVSFDAGEGSGAMTDAEIAPGGAYTLPACDLSAPEGYVFKCWSVGGEEKAVGAEITVSGDVTVSAVWELKTYTITFKAGEGASGTMAAATAKHGDTYTLPASAFTAPEGKQFKCWNVNGDERLAGSVVPVNSELTVTAVWEDVPVAAPETTEAPAPETTEAPAPETTETEAVETTESAEAETDVTETTEDVAFETTETPAPETTETEAPATTESNAPETTETEAVDTQAPETTEPETNVTVDPETNEPTTPESEAESTPADDEQGKKGLGVGAIIGIAAGGAVVVGAGVFAIIWFAVKRRTWGDLVEAIKRK